MDEAVARAQSASDRFDEAQREHLVMIAGWYPGSSPLHACCLWLGVIQACMCTFCICWGRAVKGGVWIGLI